MKKRKTGKKTVEQIAYHEAGHTVMAWLLSRKFDYVTIDPTVDTDPGKEEAEGHVLFKELLSVRYLDVMIDSWRGQFLADREIMIGLAGYISERFSLGLSAKEFIKNGEYRGSSEDFRRAYELASWLWPDDEEVIAYFRWLFIRVKNILRNEINWSLVECLVEELLKRRKISYRKVRWILHEAQVKLVIKKGKEREKTRKILSDCVEF